MPPLMTLAIPTFNRREAVLRICHSVIPLVESDEVALLVIDDGSSDSTWDALSEFARPGVTLIQHTSNVGFARTLPELIEASGTEYVVIANDDDGIDIGNLHELGSWLARIQPDFVSTKNGSIHRTNEANRPTEPIAHIKYRSASVHAPGLVFRRSATVEPLSFLREQLDKGNTAAVVYPQVLLAAWLCSEGSAWWWNKVITWEVDTLPPAHRDSSGLPYWAPMARLNQAMGFNAMLVDLAQRMPTAEGRDRVQRMHALNARTIYPAVRNAFMEVSGPASGPTLDAATLRQLSAATLRRLGGRRR